LLRQLHDDTTPGRTVPAVLNEYEQFRQIVIPFIAGVRDGLQRPQNRPTLLVNEGD